MADETQVEGQVTETTQTTEDTTPDTQQTEETQEENKETENQDEEKKTEETPEPPPEEPLSDEQETAVSEAEQAMQTEETPVDEGAVDDVSRARQSDDNPIIVDAVGNLRKVDEKMRQFEQNLTMNLPTEVSQESFTKYFAGSKLMKSMSEGLNSITENMSIGINNVINGLRDVFGSKPPLFYLTDFSRSHDYFSIAKTIKLYNPQGLKSKWLPYAQFLVKLAEEVITIDQAVLYPLGEFLAKAINQPTILMNATNKSVINVAKSDKQYDDTKKTIQKLFSGSQKEFVYWNEAFDRNTDVPAFIETLMQAKNVVGKVDPESIKKQVETIASRAKTLSEMLEKPTSGITLSPAQSKFMSETLMLAARYVELYTITLQLIYELEQCVVNSQSRLEAKKQEG